MREYEKLSVADLVALKKLFREEQCEIAEARRESYGGCSDAEVAADKELARRVDDVNRWLYNKVARIWEEL